LERKTWMAESSPAMTMERTRRTIQTSRDSKSMRGSIQV
jgi:hypothetical protein